MYSRRLGKPRPRLERELEALQEIRERHPEMTVVMLTAYPTEENVQKAWELGANGFLSKPFVLDELRNYVNKTLSEKG